MLSKENFPSLLRLKSHRESRGTTEWVAHKRNWWWHAVRSGAHVTRIQHADHLLRDSALCFVCLGCFVGFTRFARSARFANFFLVLCVCVLLDLVFNAPPSPLRTCSARHIIKRGDRGWIEQGSNYTWPLLFPLSFFLLWAFSFLLRTFSLFSSYSRFTLRSRLLSSASSPRLG